MLLKYSFGIGDRFARQGRHQLRAFTEAEKSGVIITPVWNKSHREHTTVGSAPKEVMAEAIAATEGLGWQHSYLVDADHINLDTVKEFIPHSNFFTLDVGKYIGKKAEESEIRKFVVHVRTNFLDGLNIIGVSEEFDLSLKSVKEVANKFLYSIQKATEIYSFIRKSKGNDDFCIEISMDEVESPQSRVELLLILKMISYYGIPIDTLAPKFEGRFNKGIDYEGDLSAFEKEFEDFLLIMDYAAEQFGMNPDQKLSIHTGSDKFSLYPIINRLIKKHDAGLHLKTAGTTWLEEVIGLAEAEGAALELMKEIYIEALHRFEELTSPYLTVLNINKENLPDSDKVRSWSGKLFAESIRHDQQNPLYNSDFRQLMHTAYKIAAKHGERFTDLLDEHEVLVGEHVFQNIYKRHLTPLFIQ